MVSVIKRQKLQMKWNKWIFVTPLLLSCAYHAAALTTSESDVTVALLILCCNNSFIFFLSFWLFNGARHLKKYLHLCAFSCLFAVFWMCTLVEGNSSFILVGKWCFQEVKRYKARVDWRNLLWLWCARSKFYVVVMNLSW